MLEGIVRDSMTKQASKTLRRDGYLIANIYGKGLENINAAFKKNDFIRAVKNKTEVTFDVKGARWRVWSSKTLLPEWLGEWKVSVVDDDGKVLHSDSFTYTSTN